MYTHTCAVYGDSPAQLDGPFGFFVSVYFLLYNNMSTYKMSQISSRENQKTAV